MSELPEGWQVANLGSLCEPSQYGYTAKASESGNIHFLRTTDITSGVIRWEAVPFCSVDDETCNKYLLHDGDIVISRAGSVGYSYLVRQPKRSVFASYLIRFRPKINADYLKFFLLTPSYWQSIGHHSLGIAVQNVNASSLSEILVPIAPAAEQTRIVAKLEELLSDHDAGVAELKAAQKKLTQYRQSLLKTAVEGDGASGLYPKSTLGRLVTSIAQGWSPKCERESVKDENQWAVMKTTAVQPLGFDDFYNKALPTGLSPRTDLELVPGDLLVTRAGPRARVGVTCLVRATRKKLILCDKVYRIRCDESRIDLDFLELALNSPATVQRIDALKTGISDSGLNLTQDRFFTLEIPVPSPEIQRDVVARMRLQIEAIQDQERFIQISLKQAAAQRQNILRAAFAGQLVPQDPKDEPASVLLARIRAERLAQPETRKARGRKQRESV